MRGDRRNPRQLWSAEEVRALTEAWKAGAYRIDEVAKLVKAESGILRDPEACRSKAKQLGLGPLPPLPKRGQNQGYSGANYVPRRMRTHKPKPVPAPKADGSPPVVAVPLGAYRRLYPPSPVRHMTCQWLEGDRGEWQRCHAPRLPGSRLSYCAEHHARVALPPAATRTEALEAHAA